LALPTGAGGEDVAGNEALLCIGSGLKQVCLGVMGFFKLTVSVGHFLSIQIRNFFFFPF